MRRLAPPFLLAAAAAGCVSVAPMPDPRGQLKPGQRLVVALYVSPGPWIIDAADTKAEAAAKISPMGFLMQNVQDEHTLGVSKDLQQYMPRPHYGLKVNDALMKDLRTRISSTSVQTGFEAGIVPAQLADWNKAKDQLDWRLHYYMPDPDQPAPRDYARILTLDDALILDVNVSYGTTATEDGRIVPQMSAASRAYRGDTSRLIWEHEDEVTDQTSSSTLTEFKVDPANLTNRIESLAPGLGAAVTASFSKAFFGAPSTATVRGSTATAAGQGGGLVPMAFFDNMAAAARADLAASTSAATGIAPSTAAAALALSTAAAPSPPAASLSTAAAASPPLPPPAASTPTVPIPLKP
jgi:hypothetical protein